MLIISLAHLLKAEKDSRSVTYSRLSLPLLATVAELLKTEPLEEKVKLCFVIGPQLVTIESGARILMTW